MLHWALQSSRLRFAAGVAALLMTAVWIGSAWVNAQVVDGDLRLYRIEAGCFCYHRPPGTGPFRTVRRTSGASVTMPSHPALRLSATTWSWEWSDDSEWLEFPIWPLVVLMVSAVALWHRREIVRVHRARSIRCVHCGYDRRGLAAGAPCPECGEKTAERVS